MIDAAVLKVAGSEFRGISDKQSRRFATKVKGPRADAEKVTVVPTVRAISTPCRALSISCPTTALNA